MTITYLEAIRDAHGGRHARGRARVPDRRGRRPLRRAVRRLQGPVRGVRRGARDRHADRRGGLRRRRRRRRLDGRAADRRAAVRRLHLAARSTRSSPCARQDALAQRHQHPARHPARRTAAASAAARSTPRCPEGWFVGMAGLKVVCPGSVEDAYGLLRSAIEDDDPVLYFEHKALYRRLRDEAPDDAPPHADRPGRARPRRARRDRRSTYGAGVDLALRAAAALRAEADVEVLDLRTVWPLDEAAILDVARAHQPRAGAAGGARARSASPARSLSLVARDGFELLDAPPALIAPPDTPVPFAPELEDAYLPSEEPVRPRPARAPCLLTPRRRPRAPSPPTRRPTSRARPPRALPARAAAAPDRRSAIMAALPPGPHLRQRLHRARPGGASRRRAGLALGPDDVVRAAQPRAGLPPRARGDGRGRLPQLPRQGRLAPPAGATATCTSASATATSSRSSRCSATSARSSSAPRSPSSAAASRASR